MDKEYGIHRNRDFYIVSRLPFKRVIEAKGDSVTLKTQQLGKPSQLFYLDHVTNTIKSKGWPAKSLNIADAGNKNELVLSKTDARWYQIFRYKNGLLVNERGKVAHVSGNLEKQDTEG